MSTAPPNGSRVATGSVYHYTDAGALLGIVENRVLWASEANGLNDRAEVRQGWAKVRAWLESQPDCEDVGLLRMQAERPEKEEHEVFILSASTRPDDANQWRLYANGGRGYAVEFDASEWMVAVTGSKDARNPNPGKTHLWTVGQVLADVTPWMHVLYEQSDIASALEALVDDIRARRVMLESEAHSVSGDALEEVGWGFQQLTEDAYSQLATIAHLIKEPGFAGESEVRIVATFARADAHIKYRASTYGVVGYVELAACPSGRGPIRVYHRDEVDQPLPIRSIRLGPLLQIEHGASVRGFLRKNGLDDVAVEHSQVPLR